MSTYELITLLMITGMISCAFWAGFLTAEIWLRDSAGCPEEELTVHWLVGPEESTQPGKEKETTMQINITKGYRRKLTANPTKKDGTPAELDGPLGGRIISGSATVDLVEGDPKSIWINGSGEIGDSVVEAYADARLGPEVREIAVRLDVTVRDAEAENLGLFIGEEEPIPTVPPTPNPEPTPEPNAAGV